MMVMDASWGVCWTGDDNTPGAMFHNASSECAAMAQGSEARVFLFVPFNFPLHASWSINLPDDACASTTFLFNVRHSFA